MSSPERTAALLERCLPRECLGAAPARADLPELPLAAPRELDHWREVLRCAERERLALWPVGLGSRLSWGRTPARVDLLLSSAAFSGVVSHEPADGTLTARAGTTMSELAARAADGGHHLSPESPAPGRSTLGGTLAAGASGLDRLRHGPARHQVLGMRAFHADGTLVKSGGGVVKNVTGYDLHRLWCGSQGTLCALAEVSLRLYPLPAEQALVRASFDRREDALELAREVARTPLAPVALVVHDRGAGGAWELELVLAARAEVLRFELQRALELLPGAETLSGPAAAAARARLRDLELVDGGQGGPGRWAPLWLACRPSRLGAVLAALDRATREQGLRARIACHPLLATTAVDLEGPGRDASGGERLLALQQALSGAGAELAWRDGPAVLRRPLEALDRPTGPTGAGALMRRLKQALDPTGVFACGAFP